MGNARVEWERDRQGREEAEEEALLAIRWEGFDTSLAAHPPTMGRLASHEDPEQAGHEGRA